MQHRVYQIFILFIHLAYEVQLQYITMINQRGPALTAAHTHIRTQTNKHILIYTNIQTVNTQIRFIVKYV